MVQQTMVNASFDAQISSLQGQAVMALVVGIASAAIAVGGLAGGASTAEGMLLQSAQQAIAQFGQAGSLGLQAVSKEAEKDQTQTQMYQQEALKAKDRSIQMLDQILQIMEDLFKGKAQTISSMASKFA